MIGRSIIRSRHRGVNGGRRPQSPAAYGSGGGSMATILQSLALDRWVEPAGSLADIASAVDGHVVAHVSSAGLDFGAMARHARGVGGPALRKLSFHQRADR